MIRHIRLTLASLLLLSVGVLPALGQQQKTVAVMSVSSINGLLGNIGYLTEAAGSPDVGQMVTMMSGAYLEGIDRGNPVGMILNTDGQEFVPMGFVPVKDLEQVLAVLEDSVGSPQDAGNGIKEIPGPQPMFVKEQGGWAYIGQTIESMAKLPANPAALLGNLPKAYDFALQGNIQNIPEEYLQYAIEGLQEGIKSGLEQLPEEDREQQEKLLDVQFEQMKTMMTESDQIVLGWKTEPANKRTYIDIAFTAVPGGKLAKQMNNMADAKSDYSGFIVPGAAMSMNFAGEAPPEQMQASIDAILGMKETAMKEIDRDDDLDDESRVAAKELAGAAIDIYVETLKTGKLDGAMSVVLKPGEIQLLGGFHVADGKDVEAILRRVEKMAKNEPAFPGIKFDADKMGGIAFHTMSMEVPSDEEGARKILGDTMEMAVGVADQGAYIGFGRNCVANLKQVISSQPKQKSVTPFDMTVSLTPIMKFVASVEDNPLIGAVTDALEQDDKDHVRLQVRPKKNGFIYRIEMEEGILRAIGEGIGIANAGGF